MAGYDECLEDLRQVFGVIAGFLGEVVSDAFQALIPEIPEADTDTLFQLAQTILDGASVHADHVEELVPLMRSLSQWSGDGAPTAAQLALRGHLEQTIGDMYGLSAYGQNVQGGALEIETAKYLALINLFMLAEALLDIAIAVIYSLGVSLAGIPVAIAACREGIWTAIRDLLANLAERGGTTLAGLFSKDALREMVVKNMVNRTVMAAAGSDLRMGGLRLAWNVLTRGPAAAFAERALARDLLRDLEAQALRDVVGQIAGRNLVGLVAREAWYGALNGAKGFIIFGVVQDLVVASIELARHHETTVTPASFLVDVGQNAVIGFVGGALSLGFHGRGAQATTMGLGSLAVSLPERAWDQ